MRSYRPVVIESPYAGNIERNKEYLKACMRDCIMNHEDAPYASHKLYTDVLNDTDCIERDIGIRAGFSWTQFADACVVYYDFGISVGMKLGIENAEKYGIPVEMRRLPHDDLMKIKM